VVCLFEITPFVVEEFDEDVDVDDIIDPVAVKIADASKEELLALAEDEATEED
jgi:hypothetical protein